MSRYKVEYIHTEPENKKWYNPGNLVDGWTLSKELEALLLEYEERGYYMRSMEAINSLTKMNQPRTDGILVVFEKNNLPI